jgi:hypothetical protein
MDNSHSIINGIILPKAPKLQKLRNSNLEPYMGTCPHWDAEQLPSTTNNVTVSAGFKCWNKGKGH